MLIMLIIAKRAFHWLQQAWPDRFTLHHGMHVIIIFDQVMAMDQHAACRAQISAWSTIPWRDRHRPRRQIARPHKTHSRPELRHRDVPPTVWLTYVPVTAGCVALLTTLRARVVKGTIDCRGQVHKWGIQHLPRPRLRNSNASRCEYTLPARTRLRTCM